MISMILIEIIAFIGMLMRCYHSLELSIRGNGSDLCKIRMVIDDLIFKVSKNKLTDYVFDIETNHKNNLVRKL